MCFRARDLRFIVLEISKTNSSKYFLPFCSPLSHLHSRTSHHLSSLCVCATLCGRLAGCLEGKSGEGTSQVRVRFFLGGNLEISGKSHNALRNENTQNAVQRVGMTQLTKQTIGGSTLRDCLLRRNCENQIQQSFVSRKEPYNLV